MAVSIGLRRAREIAMALSSLGPVKGDEAREIYRQCCLVVMRRCVPVDNQGDFVSALGFDPRPKVKELSK